MQGQALHLPKGASRHLPLSLSPKQIPQEVSAYKQVLNPERRCVLRHYSRDKAPSGAFRLPTGLRVPPQGCSLLRVREASHKYGSMHRDYLEVKLERKERHLPMFCGISPLVLAYITLK